MGGRLCLISPTQRMVVQMADYLTFASAEPFSIAVRNATKNWDGALYYSTDAEVWNEWDGTTAIASALHGGEQKIYMRGTGNSLITGQNNILLRDYHGWALTGSSVRCVGNIENLLDWEAVANGKHPQMAGYCYAELFNAWPALTTAPELPATTLSAYCYRAMFTGCSSLVNAPELPATTLAYGCYYGMFYECTSLATVPSLPATILPEQCYYYMFYGCTSLKFSTTQSDEYPNEYRIPTSGEGTDELTSLGLTFSYTGGTFKGNGTINTTYYTANEVIYPDTPVTPSPIDPTSMLMGWLLGGRIAGSRGD